MISPITKVLKLVSTLALLLFSNFLVAMEPLVIVTDPWPPYTIKGGSNASGTDIEIIESVFADMGIPIIIHFCPWEHCLTLVEGKKADAILDASITEERKAFLHFPSEPVSQGITVFFIKKDRTIPFTDLKSLEHLNAGAIRGYTYCEDIDNAPFTLKAERVSTLEQNFNKLMSNKIDFVIEVDAVGFYKAKEMNLSDQVTTIANANYCQGGNYLGFAKKTGLEQLAKQFSTALSDFKTTKAYQQILKKYGRETPNNNTHK